MKDDLSRFIGYSYDEKFYDNLEDCIQYMVNSGLEKEEIVGCKIDECEEFHCFEFDNERRYFPDIENFVHADLYNKFGDDSYDSGEYTSNRIDEILKEHINLAAIKEELERLTLWIQTGKKHIITEEEYDEYEW